MVGETYYFIVIARGFLPSFVRYGKNTLLRAHNITTRTKFIVRNTDRIYCSSCKTKATVFYYLKSLSLCFVQCS